MAVSKTAWTFERTRAGYGNLWRQAGIKPGTDAKNADKFAKKIISAETKYKTVQLATGVPWFFIGALHMRESGLDFAGVLHNGEKIIGKGRKTKLVPAGRGPFATWEDAAADALKLKSLHKITDWSIERMGYEGERFNGLGYVGKGVNSAYLWAGSTLEQSGKYVADHVWNKSFDDPQIGVMTVIKRLCELRSDIDKAVNGKFVPPAPDIPEPEPVPEQPTPTESIPWYKRLRNWIGGGTILGGSLGGGGAATGWDWHLFFAIAGSCVVIGLILFAIALWLFGKEGVAGWVKKMVGA